MGAHPQEVNLFQNRGIEMNNGNGKAPGATPVVMPQIGDFIKPGDTFVALKLDKTTGLASVLSSEDFEHPLIAIQFALNTLGATLAAIVEASKGNQSRIVKPNLIFRG